MYSADTYATAFLEATSTLSGHSREEAVKRFVALVHKQGNARRLPQVAETFERMVVKKEGGKYVELSVANELAEKLLKELKSNFSNKDHVTTKVDQTLIAGVRVTIDGEHELDWSMQARLNKIFQ